MKVVFLVCFFSFALFADKVVFEKYCWGCHHETSLAFGPSFKEIADKRTAGEIMAYINNPKSLFKAFGYKRSVMPAFELSETEYQQISSYIKSFEGR